MATVPVEPLLTAHLLRRVDAKLIELLRELHPEEWDLPTIVPGWRVREVAAHLLDTATRKLSLVRDACFVEKVEIASPADLVDFVNRMNREGVAVYRRLSPSVLIDMLTLICGQYAAFHESLDPFAPAAFAVSWAGEAVSANWFDTARELTERWHHQQQIRLAVGREGILTPELCHPVLDSFLRGLPHRFREVTAPEGTRLIVTIAGESGGDWTLVREGARWILWKGAAESASAKISIPEEIAWRVFTKGIASAEARRLSMVEGDEALGGKVLGLVAIVA